MFARNQNLFKKTFYTLALILPMALSFFTVNNAWALTTDLYRTPELPKVIKTSKDKYEKWIQDQKDRTKEIKEIDQTLPTLKRGAELNPRKNREALIALQDQLDRKKVLEEKLAYYKPRINKQKNIILTLEKAYRQRQWEDQTLPTGKPGSWSSTEAKQAEKIYKTKLDRAILRENYYKKKYMRETPRDISDAAKRQNYLSTLKTEKQNLERNYYAARDQAQFLSHEENYYEEKEQMAAKRYAREDRIPVENRAPPPAPPPMAVEPVKPAIPAITPETAPPKPFPHPEVVAEPEDFFGKFDQFLMGNKLAGLIALFLTTTLAIFFPIEWTDYKNIRHTVRSAIILGAIITLIFSIPIFGGFLGFICFVLAIPFYYKLSLGEYTRVLIFSVGTFLGSGALIFGILWFFLG